MAPLEPASCCTSALTSAEVSPERFIADCMNSVMAVASPDVPAVGNIMPHGLVPVPGGVLVRDRRGGIVGAVGISGDSSGNDEIAAIAGIEAAGFTADPG